MSLLAWDDRREQEVCVNMWNLKRVRTGSKKGTLTSHETPSRPWQFVAVDLFGLNGKSYLETVDYFSDLFELDHLRSTPSVYVINKLKGHFARHGIFEQLVTANGPQFVSRDFEHSPAVHIIISRMERLRALWSKPRKFCWSAARLVQTRFLQLLYWTTETHRLRVCKSAQLSGYLAEGQEVSSRWLLHH